MNLIPFTALLKTWPPVVWIKTKSFGLIICNHPHHGCGLVLSPAGSSGSLHRSYTKVLTIPRGPRLSPMCLPFYLECPEPLLTCPTPFHPSELSCSNPSLRKPAFFPISPAQLKVRTPPQMFSWRAMIDISPSPASFNSNSKPYPPVNP